MTTLRQRVVEAMADAPNPMFFGKGGLENAMMVAEDMFDAMLDVLETDEPIVQRSDGAYAPGDLYANVLLAVLREDR